MKFAFSSLLPTGLLGLVLLHGVSAAPVSGSSSLDLDLREASESLTLDARNDAFGAGGLLSERDVFGEYRRGDVVNDDELYARSEDDYGLYGRSDDDKLFFRSGAEDLLVRAEQELELRSDFNSRSQSPEETTLEARSKIGRKIGGFFKGLWHKAKGLIGFRRDSNESLYERSGDLHGRDEELVYGRRDAEGSQLERRNALLGPLARY